MHPKRKATYQVPLESSQSSPDKASKRKRKSRRYEPLSHHPSQSSVDVPLAVKIQVKASQDKRCWLCNQKAHKTIRPLQIAHIFPQAISKRRIHFERHHKSGRIQVDNIHNIANLVALCSICHFAFDKEEWAFLPKDMAAWVQDAEAPHERDFVLELNSQRNIKFQRWRLVVDPDSEAERDNHFKSAFTNEPIKEWSGEVGLVILANANILGTAPDKTNKDLHKAIDDYHKLLKIWLDYENPCSKQECVICSFKRKDSKFEEKGEDEEEGEDKEVGEGKGENEDEDEVEDEDDDDEDEDEDDDDEDEDEDDDDEDEDEDDDDEDEDEDDEDEDEDDDDEDEDEDDEDEDDTTKKRGRCYRKSTSRSRRISPREALRAAQSALTATTHKHLNEPQPVTKNEPRPVTKNRNKSKHKKSALYDESVPYSYREGYTWRNTTSNELMAIWQGVGYRKLPNGQIIITRPDFAYRNKKAPSQQTNSEAC